MQQSDLFGSGPSLAQAQTHRLFFALWPDEPTRQRIHNVAKHLHASQEGGGRLIGLHRYHLTLQFLGDFAPIPPSTLERASAAAERVRVPAFTLPLDLASSFPNRDRPWWVGCGQVPTGLIALWDQLGRELAKAGVPVKSGHALAPHITVSRSNRRVLPATSIEPTPWRVDSFVLLDSLQGADRDYRPLGSWPLPPGG